MADFRIVVTIDPTGAKRGGQQVERSLQRVGSQADRTRGLITRAFAFVGVITAVRSLVSTLATFEQSMATVRAITGANEQQFAALREEAERLGSTTRFTASQAAEGATFLARAGFDTDQVLASLNDTLLLAQAGALDLGRAADIASNILTGFRLRADEAGRVVDVLAFAANNSNTNVLQLGDAMKFVAPVAAGLGVSLEETAAAIGALSDAGLQASLAGTGLRRVLSELESPSMKTREILQSVGLTADDVRVSQVGLTVAVRALADAGVDTGAALELFGDRGGPAFEVLSSSLPKVQQMTEALGEAGGTARRIADIMDDNLNGALLRVASAFESVVLSFGSLGPTDNLTQGFNSLASVLRIVADNLDVLGTVVIALALVFASRYVTALGRTAVASIGAQRETIRLQLALARMDGIARRSALGMLLASRAATALRGALAFLGGPVGVVLLAAFAIYEFASSNDRARESLFELPGSIDAFRESLERLTHAQQQAQAFEIQDVLGEVESEIDQVERRLSELQQEGPNQAIIFGSPFEVGRGPDTRSREIDETQAELDTLRQRAAAEQQRLAAIREAQGFVGPRPGPGVPVGAETETGAGTEPPPPSFDTDAVERANKIVEQIHQSTQERIADLTLDRIGLIDREETALIERLREAGETQGADVAAVQRAIAAVTRSASLERAEVLAKEAEAVNSVIEQLEFESSQLGRTSEEQRLYNELKRAGVSADSEAGREIANIIARIREQTEANEDLIESERNHERAVQSIRSQFDALLPAYGQAVVQANRWRDEALAGLDPLRAGYENFRMQVEEIYEGLVEQAREARDAEAERATQELALEHARALEEVRQRQVAVGLASRDAAREAELWANTVREGIDATAAGATEALAAIDAIVERQRLLATDDPLVGIRVGLDQLGTEIPSVAERIADVTTKSFQGMEDALTNFVTTGKLDFSSLVDSILADIARIAVQQAIIGPLSGILSGVFGGASAAAGGSSGFFGGAAGGLVTGPGGPRSDSILARLSDGEFVVNAASTKRHRSLLEAINSSPRFQQGGLVGIPPTAVPQTAEGGVVVQVIDQRTTAPDDESMSVSESRGPDGSRLVRITIRDSVRASIASGELDSSLGKRYGVRPSIARR